MTLASKVWLITGCSSGMGRALALEALSRGDRVIATARSVARLAELRERGATTIALDVTSPDDVVREAVASAVAVNDGRLDILVNNAGYSLVGSVEECSAEEIADIYDTHVFGVYRMIRIALPYMRAQKSGVIANIGSQGGRRAFPATGVYCATKFAIAGLSESVSVEVAHLGIEVTCVDLGSFRTDFGNKAIEAKKSVPDAGPAVENMKKYLVLRNGRQAGDPAKGARAIADALTKSGRCAGKQLPVRLAVGSESLTFVGSVLERDMKDLKEWAELMSDTDHADAATAPSLIAATGAKDLN